VENTLIIILNDQEEMSEVQLCAS